MDTVRKEMVKAKSVLASLEFFAIAFVICLRLRKESFYSPDGIFILTDDWDGE